MKSGKLSNTILKRSVLKRIKKRGNVLEAKPSVGADCAVLKNKNCDKVLVSTTQGRWMVYSAANNIAVKGGRIVAVQSGITLPVKSAETKLKEIVSEIERQCEKLEIPISGGHTQVTPKVNDAIVSITGVGYANAGVDIKKAECGQEIVAVGYVGISGVRTIVDLKQEEILKMYGQDIIDKAIGDEKELLALKACDIGFENGACYMHDISEGGIWAALWDIAEYCNVGLEVDLKAIPVRQEIIEICEMFDINPYRLESVGGVLMTCNHGNELVDILKKNGIKATVIGKITDGNQKIIKNRDEVRYLDNPQPDELEKIYAEII